MILEILKSTNPILKKKAKPVKAVTKEIRDLIRDMEETMRAAPGIGLAAPQVGHSIRLILVDIGEGLHVVINPKITQRAGSHVMVEGCLSVPRIEAPVERSEKITVKGMNPQGKNIEIKAEGLLAIVFQHEIDHLDGVLFVDRVKDKNLIRYVPPKETGKEVL